HAPRSFLLFDPTHQLSVEKISTPAPCEIPTPPRKTSKQSSLGTAVLSSPRLEPRQTPVRDKKGAPRGEGPEADEPCRNHPTTPTRPAPVRRSGRYGATSYRSSSVSSEA